MKSLLHKWVAIVFEDSSIAHHKIREMLDGIQFQRM
jgi:hypothetical protein